MLIITRKKSKKIMIGHDIVIQVIDVDGRGVILGIEAPDDVEIWREELYNQQYPNKPKLS